jgi:hypothetical protein
VDQADELAQALERLAASGRVEVRENGAWLAALAGAQFEVRRQGSHTLVHLWSEEQNLVRRVVRIAEQSDERLLLEVLRFGRSKPDRLELLLADRERPAARRSREEFRGRLRQLLAEQFPDEPVDALTTAADLEHSLSGCYTRGLMHRGSRAWAVVGVSPAEDAATADSVLTYALIWLDAARQRARERSVAGLRLFLPEGKVRITTHRLSALDPAVQIELYEIEESLGRARRVDPRDIGNLSTRLTPRREVELILNQAREATEKIRSLAPDAIRLGVVPGTREVTLRFRGAEFARWQNGRIFFGLGDDREELTERKWGALEALVRELEIYRSPVAQDTNHALYRMQAERWLEANVQGDPARIDARLDPAQLYAQVPAFAAGDRGVIDLLGVTRDGRLAVIELKADENIHLPLQAVDYWLRVRWHQRQDDFRRHGYFAGIELQPKPPLLYLVAPSLRFHPTTGTLVRCLSNEIEVACVGLNEDWRRGLRVVFRQ